ncbi:MAG: zinc ribbon domain-containing protein [Anaerolineae bacterium]|nr:MAG: zinc ribbon domain-containing protein [Anaerolineae bacterium]
MSENIKELVCTNCGETVTDKMRICPYCGHALKAGAASQTQPVYQTQPPPPYAAQPQIIVVPSPAQPAKEEKEISNVAAGLTLVVWAFVGFLLVYGTSLVWGRYGRFIEPYTPFIGMYSAEAAGVAQNYVEEVYPSFAGGDRTVSAAYLDGVPVYVVDYVLEDWAGAQGLRLVVSRRLDDVYPIEYLDGR